MNNKITASFFLTGDFYKKYPSIVKKLKAKGNYLGPHSNKHLLYADWEKRDSTLISASDFKKDLLDNYDVMKKVGLKIDEPKYFLPAYEWYNQNISNWSKEENIQLINFTPGTGSNADYTTPDIKNYQSSKAIYNKILNYEIKNTLNGFILLLHIGTDHKRTDKFYYLLDDLIKELKSRGYTFVSINQLFQ